MSFAETLRNVLAHRVPPTNLTESLIEAGTFTPTFTFETPGDLSVSYAVQDGQYWRVGNLVFANMRVEFTPTFTTASGAASISIPFARDMNRDVFWPISTSANLAWPTGTSVLFARVGSGNTDTLSIDAHGSSLDSVSLVASDFTSGSVLNFLTGGTYAISAG